MQVEITNDCFCEHYLHEATNYPRPGLVEQKFQKGDVLDVIEEWQNFYGSYYRCKTEVGTADISKRNAIIKN
jgi:hypothetical protein